jgi:hypothetical protein
MLTGVAVLIMPGSLIQLVISLAVLVVYAVAVSQCRPYRMERDNILALLLYAMLAATLVSSLQAHKLIQIYTNADYCLVPFFIYLDPIRQFIGLLLKVKDGYESNGKR